MYNAYLNSKFFGQLVAGKMSNPYMNRRFCGKLPIYDLKVFAATCSSQGQNV